MPSRWTEDTRACQPSFARSLRTSWLPDAFADSGLLGRLSEGAFLRSPSDVPPLIANAPLHWLTVPVGERVRTVPLLPADVYAGLHVLVERALRGHAFQPGAHNGTHTDWDYRSAYRDRSESLTALASDGESPWIQHLDIENFGPGVRLDTLLAAPWMTEELGSALRVVRRRTGQCLLHAGSWSTRLGSALLTPLDEVVAQHVGDRWARWSDGWHIAVRDPEEGARIREAVAAELGRAGLRLSPRKTALLPPAAVLAGVAANVAGPPGEVWRLAVRHDDVRRYRYALPRAAPAPEISAALPGLVRRHPALLPRAALHLDRAATTAQAPGTFTALLRWATGRGPTREAPFRCGRLLVLAARHPHFARLVPLSALDRWCASSVAPLRDLAERAAVTGYGPDAVRDPGPRTRDWIRGGASVTDRPPQAATLL
ncbi:hypothetical protein AB0J21_10425 [Streptomyces sp. NPDC049954]|uniref:hypothetical protein n=1 Tax=Streptomyces sp. NPDC049954 TaxID=3155779 RepID=UPI00342BA1A8